MADNPVALLEQLNRGARSALDMAAASGVSRPTVARQLQSLVRQRVVLVMGAARSARYARRRLLPELGADHWPIYRVDAQGLPQPWGALYLLMADQYFVELHPDAAVTRAPQGLSDGLPYFLQDQRPAGFMGRNVPQRYPELNLPQRVVDWTDIHYLRYLTQQGWDAVSDLIVGEAALNHFLAREVHAVSAQARLMHYAEQADIVTAGGLPGSSAHGEHPKFVCAVKQNDVIQQRLVKFSPPRHTDVGQRWSDLLVAEHHAHVLLREAGFAALFKVHVQGERTYLEMPRFDRVGARGRRGVTSLFAIDTALYGQLDDWIAAAQRLHRARKLSADDLRRVQFLSAFGELIANTDRHFGNLALFDDYSGMFTLAPSYDMLPMLFAPQHDQVLAREFVPPPPSAATLPVWRDAHALARRYWRELSVDPRLSAGFQKIGADCLAALDRQLAKLHL